MDRYVTFLKSALFQKEVNVNVTQNKRKIKKKKTSYLLQ